MRLGALILILVAGCSSQPTKPTKPTTATATQSLATILSHSLHNLHDTRATVYAVVIPFVPEVTLALARLHQLKNGLSDSAAYEWGFALTRAGSGLLVDPDANTYNPSASPDSAIRDSILFFVSLTNQTYPCVPPTVAGVPLLRQSDVPCVSPEIAPLRDHVYLVVEGDTVRPRWIYGRKRDILGPEERMWVSFDLGGRQLKGGRLVIDAFDNIQPTMRWEL